MVGDETADLLHHRAEDDQPIGTVASEGSGSLVDEAKERGQDIVANAQGDDYHEQR